MDHDLTLGLLTSTAAVALGFAGIAYLLLINKKSKPRNATEAFNYLNIHIITTREACDEAIRELLRRIQGIEAVGFDCEWVTESGKRHPVALIQLSTIDGYCALFRMNCLRTMPESLKNFLEDESIFKIGVVPADDAKYLCQDYDVYLRSTLDVRHVALLCGQDNGAGGLGAMAKSILNVELDKSWRIRCSDWEDEELSFRQVNYAAADAHVAIKLLVTLIERSAGLLGWFQRYNMSQRVMDVCIKYADVSFKTNKSLKQKMHYIKPCKESRAALRITKRNENSLRKSPLYHNCFMLAPDGEVLCTCDNKKALWYVEKNLAEKIKEDPLTVRLRFEPKGRAVGDVGNYYKLVKENRCVVCGQSDSYIRKNVVPREYRKYFPEIMKDHSSHDVLLLCSSCHQRSNALDRPLRDRLALACAAPLPSKQHQMYSEDTHVKKIKSAARALLYQSKKHQLPDQRRVELENIVLQHYPQYEEVTQDLLQQAANLDPLIHNAEIESHGQRVVEYFLREGGLLVLEEMWRGNFLTLMKPKYMPQLWSIKHNEERLDIKVKEGRLSIEDLKSIGPCKWV